MTQNQLYMVNPGHTISIRRNGKYEVFQAGDIVDMHHRSQDEITFLVKVKQVIEPVVIVTEPETNNSVPAWDEPGETELTDIGEEVTNFEEK